MFSCIFLHRHTLSSTLFQPFESIGLNYAGNEIENILLFMSILHLTAILLTVIASDMAPSKRV